MPMFKFILQNQFNTSICSNVSFTTMENQLNDEYRSSAVRFKEDSGRDSNLKIQPMWRPGCESDSESPRYRSIKPILTPTTGRSSIGPSPIPPSAFEKPQRFTSTSEQFTRDVQVLKPKPVSARYQSKPFSSDSMKSTQFYTATTGQPYHNQKNVASESSSHVEIREATESTQRIVNMSSTRKIITYDQHQQQHQQHVQNALEKSLEPFPFTVSPTPSQSRQKYRPPPTPTKFVPGEFRESDYDSEIESIKIRPLWTPNPNEPEQLHYRHVSPPTPGRSSSVPKHHFERILTPMEFDVSTVEMPSQIKILPSSPNYLNQQHSQFKTQTLDRFRSKKKSNSNFGTSSQDDINIAHSTPKYSRMRSPSHSYHEESRASQYGKLQHFLTNDLYKMSKKVFAWFSSSFTKKKKHFLLKISFRIYPNTVQNSMIYKNWVNHINMS